VKVTVLLARPDLYKEMNEAYAEFFPGAKPARAMVHFGVDIPGVFVAMEAIALARLLRGSLRRLVPHGGFGRGSAITVLKRFRPKCGRDGHC
jgi:hypothetical protein